MTGSQDHRWVPGGRAGDGSWPPDMRPFAHAQWDDPSTWGVPKRSICWFVGLFFLHLFAVFMLWVTQRYWRKSTDPSKRGSLAAAAFEVPSLAGAVYFGVMGVILQTEFWNHPLADPLHGEHAGARALCETMLGCQAYALAQALVIPAMRQPLFIVHHFVSMLLAQQTLLPYLTGYVPFYFGIVEITNWPLCIADFLRAIPELKERHHRLWSNCRILFAPIFIVIRLVVWTFLALWFWYDSIGLLSSGRQRSMFAVLCFLVSNIIMTGMQWNWGAIVIRGIIKLLRGGNDKAPPAVPKPQPTQTEPSKLAD